MTTIEALNYQINSPTEDKFLRQFSATCARVICTRGSLKKPLVLTQLKFERKSPYQTDILWFDSANVCPYQALFTVFRVLTLTLLLRVHFLCFLVFFFLQVNSTTHNKFPKSHSTSSMDGMAPSAPNAMLPRRDLTKIRAAVTNLSNDEPTNTHARADFLNCSKGTQKLANFFEPTSSHLRNEDHEAGSAISSRNFRVNTWQQPMQLPSMLSA